MMVSYVIVHNLNFFKHYNFCCAYALECHLLALSSTNSTNSFPDWYQAAYNMGSSAVFAIVIN